VEYRRISNARTEHGRQYVGAGYSSWTASNPAGRLAKESMECTFGVCVEKSHKGVQKAKSPQDRKNLSTADTSQ
jgi:hypothetical protein